MDWSNKQILRNDIDEDYMEIHNGMKDNINQILLRIFEDSNQKRNREFILQGFQKMQSDTITKEFALKIIDILYSEESLIKTAITDRVEAEIIKDANKQRNKSIN